jgi:hypothetical protein
MSFPAGSDSETAPGRALDAEARGLSRRWLRGEGNASADLDSWPRFVVAGALRHTRFVCPRPLDCPPCTVCVHPEQRSHPPARAFRIVGMTVRALQAGDRIRVGGGYDYEVEWMAAARGDFGYPGTVVEFISGQNQQRAAVIELDEELVLPHGAGEGRDESCGASSWYSN